MDWSVLDAWEKELRGVLPDDWEEKFETHEDLYGLFERSYDRVDAIAWGMLAMLRQCKAQAG